MSYRTLFLPFILILSLFFAACAPAIKEISLSSKPIIYQGFSLILPQESGWMMRGDDNTQLVKLGTHNDETYVIEVYAPEISQKIKSHEQIVKIFNQGPPQESDSERFKIITQELTKGIYKGQPSWKQRKVAEDHGTVTGKMMILEIYTFYVLHPQDKEIVVLSYSHRYYPGDEDAHIVSKANQLFESLEFIKL